MIRNFKNYIVTENTSYNKALLSIYEAIVEIIKDDVIKNAKFGGEPLMDESMFNEYVTTVFADEYDIFTESFMRNNFNEIKQTAWKKYGQTVDGIKIYNFGNVKKDKVMKFINGELEF